MSFAFRRGLIFWHGGQRREWCDGGNGLGIWGILPMLCGSFALGKASGNASDGFSNTLGISIRTFVRNVIK